MNMISSHIAMTVKIAQRHRPRILDRHQTRIGEQQEQDDGIDDLEPATIPLPDPFGAERRSG